MQLNDNQSFSPDTRILNAWVISMHVTLFVLLTITFIFYNLSISKAALPACGGTLNGYVMPDTDDTLKFCDGSDWVLLGLDGGEAAASKWNTDGESNLYYDLNNVGIDENNPTAQMQINGAINVDGTIHSDQAIIGTRGLQLSALVTDEDCLGSDDYGNMRYNAAINKIEVCAGYKWIDSAGPEWSDGLIGESQILEPSTPEVDSQFGSYISTDGDTAIISAHLEDDSGTDRGAVYVFVRDSDGVWNEQQRLTADDAADTDRFGFGVYIRGNEVFISSATSNSESPPQSALYVFTRSGTTWSQTQKLLSPLGASNFFGFDKRVKISSGNELFIGDPSTSSSAGSVLLYTKENGYWVYKQEITPIVRNVSANFGDSLSTDNDFLIVSAGLDDKQSVDNGAVYIFKKEGKNWKEKQIIYSGNAQNGLRFGRAGVVLQDDLLVISTTNEDDILTDKGFIYIYEWDGVEFLFKQKLNDANYDSASYDCFGRNPQIITRQTVITGRCGGNFSRFGRAFIIEKSANTWRITKEIYGINEAHAGFSSDISVTNKEIILGADQSVKNGTKSGLAFVFSKTQSNGNPWYGALPLIEETKHIPSSLSADDMDFTNHAPLIDTNKDTLVVGAPLNDIQAGNAGMVYIYSRSGNTWSEATQLFEPTPVIQNNFGQAVALSATHLAIASKANGGTLHVYSGSGAAWGLQQTITTSLDTDAIDIHGRHIIIGDRSASLDGGSTSPGAIKIYTQNDVGTWLESTSMTASNSNDGDLFGSSVAIYDDFAVVGAPEHGGDGTVYILSRLGNIWMESTELSIVDGDNTNALIGSCVDMHKDTIIIGAEDKNASAASHGSAYIFKRSGNDWSQKTVLLPKPSEQEPTDNFGYSCKLHGDTAIIGVNSDSELSSNSGAAYIFTRNSDGTWREENKLNASDHAADDLYGTNVSLFDKTAIVSAPRADAAGTDSGAFYTYTINDF